MDEILPFFFISEVLRNEDGNIGGPCQGEMKAHRLMLMEDHAISPELVAKCGTDIDTNCKGFRDQIYEQNTFKNLFFLMKFLSEKFFAI